MKSHDTDEGKQILRRQLQLQVSQRKRFRLQFTVADMLIAVVLVSVYCLLAAQCFGTKSSGPGHYITAGVVAQSIIHTWFAVIWISVLIGAKKLRSFLGFAIAGCVGIALTSHMTLYIWGNGRGSSPFFAIWFALLIFGMFANLGGAINAFYLRENVVGAVSLIIGLLSIVASLIILFTGA
jgi:hypothetical protein